MTNVRLYKLETAIQLYIIKYKNSLPEVMISSFTVAAFKYFELTLLKKSDQRMGWGGESYRKTKNSSI